MRFSAVFPACFFLAFCWVAGAAWNDADIKAQKAEQEHPYIALMHEAVDELRQRNISVTYPKYLPLLRFCSACLERHESFGAYQASEDEVIMPDNFDVASIDGRARLIHEYGHFLLTKADIDTETQEPLCLMLGNNVYRRAFALAENH